MSQSQERNTRSAPDAFSETRAFSEKYLSIMFAQILEAVSKSFHNIIEDLKDPQEKLKLTEKLNTLKAVQHTILQEIKTEINDTFTGHKTPPNKNSDTGLSLSLVDDEELEESIIISDVSSKVAEKYDLPIRAIRRGIVRLSRKLDFEPDPDAITPKHLANTLQHALRPYNLGLTDKSIIYSCYRDIATLRLETLYSGILTLFQEYHLIEETENPLSANFELVYEFRNHGQIIESTQTAPPVATRIAQQAALVTPESQIHKHTTIAPDLQPPIAAHNLSSTAFQDNALTRLLYDYISHNPQAATEHKNLPPGPLLQPEKLVSILSSLQAEIDAKVDVTADATAIQQLIRARLDSSKADKHIPSVENNVIDLINKLFVAIMEDPDLPDPVKVQFGRLQIPYIKVALLDINLLKNESHPARLLLNEISLTSVGINDLDSHVLDKIKNITQSIIEHFETDLNIFAQLLEEIRQFQQEHTTQAAHAEKKTRGKAEQQAKLIFLKKNVIQQIRKFLKGKELPKALYALVLKGFAPLFLKIFHAKGDDCDEWRQTVDLFRLIVESAQAKDSTYQLGVIAQRAPEIIKRTRDLLQQWANTPASAELITDLEHYYQERAGEYKRLQLEREQTAAPHIENTTDPFDYNNNEQPATEQNTNNAPQPQDVIARLPETAKPGTWCEIYMGRNAKPQRLKISSILQDSAQIVFVDVTGHQAQIRDAQEFIDELDCERSKIIKDNNLFDKALASVITNLQYSKNLTQHLQHA